MMPSQEVPGDASSQDVDPKRKAELQAAMDERQRIASERRAWAKIVLDALRVLAWPLLVGFVVTSVLHAIEQHPRRHPGSTGNIANLTALEQRHRLDADVAAAHRHRTDAAPADDIRERVLLSEDLVLRRLGAQHGVAVRRQVALGNRADLRFDGMFVDRDGVTLVEVEYVIDEDDLVDLVDDAMTLFGRAGRELAAERASFLLVLVADMPEDRRQSLTLRATGLVGSGGRGPRICVDGFDQLCGQFGVGSEP